MKTLLSTVAAIIFVGQTGSAFAFDWNGFYAGVGLGYSSGHSDAAYDYPMFSTANIDADPSGWLFGATAGFNTSMSGIVLGAEGDLSVSDITDTIYDQAADDHGSPGESITSTTDLTGTLRGRVGFDGGNFMPYLTAGVSFANVTVEASDGPLSDSALLWGWSAGIGVEAAVAENVTVKVEYLYSNFGEHTWFDGDAWSSTSTSTSNTIRGGVNFHFD